jgi:hypothetical protein
MTIIIGRRADKEHLREWNEATVATNHSLINFSPIHFLLDDGHPHLLREQVHQNQLGAKHFAI